MNGTRKTVTTSLRPGDALPSGEPKRYLTDRGYVRLRWLVGIETYVETYEHRAVMGMPPTDMEVHHINGLKTDNCRENLVILSKSDHAILHAAYAPNMYHGKPRQPLSEYPACTESGCERPAQCSSRSLCLMHYKRFVKHGSTELRPRGKSIDKAEVRKVP